MTAAGDLGGPRRSAAVRRRPTFFRRASPYNLVDLADEDHLNPTAA
jgi:hypothetical protein